MVVSIIIINVKLDTIFAITIIVITIMSFARQRSCTVGLQLSSKQEDPLRHGKCIAGGDNDYNHGDDDSDDDDGDADDGVVYDDEGSRLVHYPTTSPPLPVFGNSKKSSAHLSKTASHLACH